MNPQLLSWLQDLRQDLQGSPSGDDHPLQGCFLEEQTRIGRLLGIGSFAAVFELESSDVDPPLAVKLLERKQGEEAAKDDELFRREVDIGMRLQHPNVTRIHRFLERPRSRFVVLDKIVGQTWAALETPLSVERYKELFGPLADGLDYAHQMGVVHRDLKPDNVMLADDGSVKILDFGMARQQGDTNVTVTGQFKGTPKYCAPEQILDSKAVTPACDQFAFALMSFEMLSGAFPYPDNPQQPFAILFARLQQPAAALSSVWPQASPEADAAMARMLSQNPGERFSSVGEAFRVFSQALS